MTITGRVFPIIGRGELIELTSAVVGGNEGAPPAVVLTGQAGIGKTTLLRHAVCVAGDGVRVLQVAGAPHPTLTYVPVVKMLWAVREYAVDLPPALRRPLAELFDGATPATSSPTLVAEAALALLEAAAVAKPLLLAVDDVDRLDDGSRELIVAVVSRLVGSRVRAVMTARRRDILGGVERVILTVAVTPLSAGQSARLVDVQLRQPDPSVRGEIIRSSRGNPLALIEYTRAYAHSGTTKLPALTEGGTAHHPVFVNQIAALPEQTRRLLLHAAAGTGHESVDVVTSAAGYENDFSYWQPACAAEVVEFTDSGHIVFANALVRSAAYADGHLGMQRAAHLALAGVTGLQGSLRAWHRAAAAAGPDETIAADLEESALAGHCRGMELELARSLQRAAELSPKRGDATRRYALAACAANFGGDPAWAFSLTDLLVQDTDDPDVAGHAALTRASILLQCSRPADAVDAVRRVLDGARPQDAHLVLALIYAAAGAAYYAGEVEHRRDLRRWLDDTAGEPITASRLPLPMPAGAAEVQRAYIAMYAETAACSNARPQTFDRGWLRPQRSSDDPSRQLVAGVMAYACEETAVAARELTGALEQLRASGGLRGFTFALAPLAWALLDTGRWVDLRQLLDEAAAMSEVQSLTLVDREINACRAQLLAFSGDVEGAAVALAHATRVTPIAAAPPRATEVALSRAAGWVAVASGDFDEAYRRFGEMFLADGDPAHFVVSHRGIADLAWAAARSGQVEQVQHVVSAVGRQLGTKPAVRLRLLHRQALAMTTVDHLAERNYKLAVFDPAGEEWPLERARARLHYGEWLRRNRRPAEARPLLIAALEVFERLGTELLAEIARAELRAAGVTTAVAVSRDALHALTAQEQQIVALAATGLTNREIADRLRLSPRTISSHLYHVYPKLGVSRRHELRQFTS